MDVTITSTKWQLSLKYQILKQKEIQNQDSYKIG
jgi:hypothetical protein